MRVGISGLPGSGKTTVARGLSEVFGLEYFSMGSIFRGIAGERDITLEELSRISETDSSMDAQIERTQVEILKRDDVILDSRLSCWLMHKENIPGMKVWITAPIDVRANRICRREKASPEEVRINIERRELSEKRRYMKYYGIDLTALSIYDIIINNRAMNPGQACDIVTVVYGGKR